MTDRIERGRAVQALVAFTVAAFLPWHAAEAQQAFPNPQVHGPVSFATPAGGEARDYPFFSQADWLAPHGYVEEEFIVEGRANRYDTDAGTIADSGHPYRTRMVVRRPASQADFNGTVLLEWQNVTAGYDLDALWSPVREHLVEAGYAWVGISAQRVGVNFLREWSPQRYGELDVTVDGAITDDAISYDIFGQAAQSIRSPAGTNPMGGLEVREIIGKGASQSAGRLLPFYNVAQPLHEPVIDVLYLAVGPGATREDQDIPVFHILSETDILGGAARGDTPRADSEGYRLWEVAGTSHSGYAGFLGRLDVAERDHGVRPELPVCDLPPYSRIPMPMVMQAAYAHMVTWVREGAPPPSAPRIGRTGEGVDRDEHGNARGGIQLSEHAVPTALNHGSNSGSGFCFLYGSHQPFDQATLAHLYPTLDGYAERVREVNEANVAEGFLLPEDAAASLEAATTPAIERHSFTTSDGWTLHYATLGDSGSPVILIHGSGGRAQTWIDNRIVHTLAENHRVIVPDMRGHGRSEGPRDGDMPLDVIELMNHLELDRAHVHGFSMGGSIVAQLMARVPERLITASFGGSGVRETDEWLAYVPEDAEGDGVREAEARQIYRDLQVTRSASEPTPAERRRLAAMEAGEWTPPARPGPDRQELDLRTIDFPVLAIVGEYDGFYARTHRLWRELSNFQSILLTERGHLDSYYPGVIDPDYLNGLRTFLLAHDEVGRR